MSEKQQNPAENEKWFDTIRKIRDYAEEEYDKLIVYLNGGALVLTVGFVKDIVTITEHTDTLLLKLSWILFTLSLLIILISHRTAIIAMNYELKEKTLISDRWDHITEILNWCAMLMLITGIICFLLFVNKSI